MQFDYHEEPAGSWESSLKTFRANGVTSLRCRVPWGAHEPVKGMKDFSKVSRLRLERLLGLAQTHQLEIELVLGFPPAKETFPPWTFAVDKKALIPATLWSGLDEGYSLTAIPSWFDTYLREAFLEFVDEVASIAHLYRKPEGPVAKVILDLGLFEFDSNAMDSAVFADRMTARYGDIEALNVRYQTSFKAFASASIGQGFRALCDRRPWLAAFDYQVCRREMLRSLEDEVRRRASLTPLGSLFEIGSAFPPSKKETRYQLAIDSVMLQSGDDRCFPFLPAGILTPMAVSAYRLAEYLSENAGEDVSVSWLGANGPTTPLVSSLIVVVSGKYLASKSMEALKASNARLVFPFGPPQYDERLERFDPLHPSPQRLDPSSFDWAEVEAMAK